MAEKGEEKLIAVARHVAKTLGRTETMTNDILQIFSTFDGRFARDKLSESSDEVARQDDRLHLSPIERTIQSLDRQIAIFVSSNRPIWSDSDSASVFLFSVDALLSIIRNLDPPLLDRAEYLLQQSMFCFENEFRSLMEASTIDLIPGSLPFDSDGYETDAEDHIPVANPVSNYDIIIDPLPPGSIADLHEIAKRMTAAGFSRELAHIYSLSRRDFLDESISRLGLRPKTTEELQSAPWPLLEDEISRWIRAVTLCFRVLFPSERRLCDRIFSNLTAVADLSFAESCRSPAIQLLNFANAIAIGSKSPERLFRIVDMYEILRDLIPDVDPLFSDQFYSIYKGLGAAIRGIFMELDNLIKRDPAKAPVPGGGLHPITRYVTNYLRAACASRKTLEEVMEEDGEGPAKDLDRPSSYLSVQIAWILEVLQGNIESKSKIYQDPSLSLIFLMNNMSYIIDKARDSELAVLMGEDWIRRQRARVRRWCRDYQRATWSKVIAVLRTDGGGGATSARKVIKERFRVFNAYFEEIWREQKGWVVVDERLREELRSSIVGFVIPAYRHFLGRCGGVVKEYVKYSAEDVEARINRLFKGDGRR